MSRRTPPSFDFFPDDFIGGTSHMRPLEVGSYIRWLCFQWGHDFLPKDPQRLAIIAHLTDDEFASVWQIVGEKFTETEDGFVNERLQTVKGEQLARRAARVEAGRKGGLSNAKAMLKQKGKQKHSKGKVEGGRRKEEGKERNGHFAPPSVDDVRQYCQSRKNRVDPQVFVDFYLSKGWLVGRQKMANWRACVRTWERNQMDSTDQPSGRGDTMTASDTLDMRIRTECAKQGIRDESQIQALLAKQRAIDSAQG